MAWNEIYKTRLPGALNAIILFTDGQPTAGTFNYAVPASMDPTGTAQSALRTSSGCKDSRAKATSNGGDIVANPPNWLVNQANSGSTLSLGSGSFWSPLSGPVGGLYGDGISLFGMWPFYSAPGSNVTSLENVVLSSSDAPGCAFPTNNNSLGNPTTDLAFMPPQDIFGNSTSGYRTGLATSSIQNSYRITVTKPNAYNVNFNLADNAANFARSPHSYSDGTAMPGTLIFTIGLGGNGGVDYTLLQRIANDPNADSHGAYPAYPAYDTTQPIGTFVYSSDTSQLQAAFTRLASMILRISR